MSKTTAPPTYTKPLGPSIRPQEAAWLFGVSVSTIWRWHLERSDFPRIRELGPNTSVFDTAELLAWRESGIRPALGRPSKRVATQ